MIHIRRAEVSDAAQIQRVYASSGTYGGTLQVPHPSVEMWQERLKNLDAKDIMLVALCDGVIVGNAVLHLEQKQRRAHAATLGMGVADAFAGRGVGSALLQELIQLADLWLNILRIELIVFCDNAAAIHLYQKFGFQIEGTHRAHALRHGVFADTYSMARLHPDQPTIKQGGC
ncbi:GNAT family N-acetyltransferase [Undibacterium oligocarboniphilum]|uniref:GNAT family N-acetyltransferase n=1 Tax=Undibacterium oligocarboniphilum TaxID=666702 RepID=A0A850QLK7_9BURK|nr:GNAT family N-acetyltransferase [Undibacterium oligocarboniphilum]MBC3869671.1 GNAT family N-acetyltransferase [Undibacterium oligocarboniphilum]NVO77274.1 GNAT family N-acetyltransferase [Undibacterium oligocarboniphilum]